jgi:hypothetical protein
MVGDDEKISERIEEPFPALVFAGSTLTAARGGAARAAAGGERQFGVARRVAVEF